MTLNNKTLKLMTENDKRLIEASTHYAISKCGRLARVSTPFKMDARTKIGVGFDYVTATGYANFNHRQSRGGSRLSIRSHRMIYYLHHGELPEFIDHIDGDKLNNNVRNLRAATRSQNGMNRKSAKGSSSKFLGVYWDKRTKKWRAQIQLKGKSKHLGLFTCEEEAAGVYNKAAAAHYGEFANLNEFQPINTNTLNYE